LNRGADTRLARPFYSGGYTQDGCLIKFQHAAEA